MKILGNIISTFGLYLVYQGISSVYRTPTPPWGSFFVLWICGFAIAAMGHTIAKSGEKSRQKENDEIAREITEQVTLGKSPNLEFALYLRPFSIDGEIKNPRDTQNFFDLEQHYRPGDDTLERLLSDAVNRTYKTVAFGFPRSEIPGVGHIGLFVDWQMRIQMLMKEASLIFVCPSIDAGVLWEVEEITKNNMLDKVVFLMPWFPHNVENSLFPSINSSPENSIDEYAKQWNIMVKSYGDMFLFDVPAYDESGGVFRYEGKEKRCVFRKVNSPVTPRALARAINSVLGT